MFKSKLALYVELDKPERRNICPISYKAGQLIAGYPAKIGKESELYMALAFMGKQVYSNTVLNKQTGVEIGAPIGEIVDIRFKRVKGERHIIFTVQIKSNLIPLFDRAE